MSDDGIVYTYVNVGIETPGSRDGVEFTYANVGLFGTPSAIGRVRGLACRPYIGVEYTYQNIEEPP